MYSCSWWPTRYVPSMTSVGRPPWPPRRRRARRCSGRTRGSASSGSKTAGRRVGPQPARGAFAARSVARSGAAMSAHGSAWCWISPPTGTSTGWSSWIRLTRFSPGMSSAVTTTTRFQSNASSSSIAVEAGVRLGRADRGAEPGAGEDEVVGVLRLAGELRRALAAERRRGPRTAGSGSVDRDDERRRVRRGAGRRGRRPAARCAWSGSGAVLHRCILASPCH